MGVLCRASEPEDVLVPVWRPGLYSRSLLHSGGLVMFRCRIVPRQAWMWLGLVGEKALLSGQLKALTVFGFVEYFALAGCIGRQAAQGVMGAGVVVHNRARDRIMKMLEVGDGFSEKIPILEDLVDGFDH